MMKPKKRAGFTLIEVVMSFVLISILVLIVGGVLTSSYLLSSKLQQLPNTYYGAQDKVEVQLDSLKSLVQEKYRIQNDLTNTPPPHVAAQLRARLAEVERELSGKRTRNVTLFGKTVELYEFSENHTTDEGTRVKILAGTPNTENLERPVPIVDKVIINPSGQQVSNEIYNGVGTQLHSRVTYFDKNSTYLNRSMYQWFVSTGSFHTAAFPEGQDPDDRYNGRVQPNYPANFTLIPGATEASITVDESHVGRFLACVVTPLSVGGKMGKSVISNLIYVSSLPQLSQGQYQMVIEPSITTVDYNQTGRTMIDTIASRYPNSGAKLNTVSTGTRPWVDLLGILTGSKPATGLERDGGFSRFISFVSGASLKATGVSASGAGTAVLVARSRDGTEFDFMYSGGQATGFVNKNSMIVADPTRRTSWKIVVTNISSLSDFEIGKNNLDVAELILLSNPSNGDITTVQNYLKAKYNFS